MLFVIELADQVLVLCFLLCPLLVGGFKLAAQVFHLGHQFFLLFAVIPSIWSKHLFRYFTVFIKSCI